MATTPRKPICLNEDFHKGPKYERLGQYLLEELTTGRLSPGEALPSELVLAEQFRVARHTVRRALAGLEKNGLIRREQGRGTFVSEDARVRLRRGLDVYALVTPETHTGYYPSLLHGFESACKDVQNQAIICTSENDLDKQGNAILQLMDKKVAGVAIVPATSPPTPAYQVRQLHNRNIPVVFCHRRVEGIHAPLLSIPFDRVSGLAGEAFLARGHRRVAMYSAHQGERYIGGLRSTMEAGGGELPEEFVWYSTVRSVDVSEHEEAILEALKRMCGRPDRPTAILATFDSQAELIYLLLSRLGLRVPEDISLVGFGGMWRHSPILRRLTSVAIDEVEIGRRAVELLDQMRNGRRPMDDSEEFVVSPALTDGETLGPVPKSCT